MKRIFKLGSAGSSEATAIAEFAAAAQESLLLQVPTERIAFHDSVQHLSVREEEEHQRSIRSLHRHQQESWFSGIIIPTSDNRENREQLWLYLTYRDQVHKVGRLRNSMVTPVFAQLKHEMDSNQRVVPVIGKVIPGGGKQAATILAYAKTDLVQFPVY